MPIMTFNRFSRKQDSKYSFSKIKNLIENLNKITYWRQKKLQVGSGTLVCHLFQDLKVCVSNLNKDFKKVSD